MYDRLVSEEEYRQRVRRHRPSSLLPLIAAAAARYGGPERPQSWWGSPYKKYVPWALADAARVSLAYGTELQRSDATEEDLLRILAAYSNLRDPTLFGDDDDTVRLRDCITRMSSEQLVWQVSEFNGLARTAALYLHTRFPAHRRPQFITPGWDMEVFGCSLADYVGTAQLIWAAALKGAGRFHPEALYGGPDGSRIAATVGQRTVEEVTARHFVTDVAEFKQTEQHSVARLKELAGPGAGQYRRFAYNPLVGRPLISGFEPGLLCPSPPLVWRKATPAGIYHTGKERLGVGFLRETGYLFEEYIGRQLRLFPGARVLGEITYTERKNERRSVDWIVVFDELVLLVEVKSMMPTEASRLGLEQGVTETDEKLSRAYRQVNTTSALIDAHHPRFAHIPADRPRQALIATLEPFPIPNAPLPHPGLPVPKIPIAVASAHEIESLATLTDTTPAALLIDRAADPQRSAWAISTCLTGHEFRRNPILDRGWAVCPWVKRRILSRDAGPAPA